jgi:hypothetical protein
MNKNLMTDKRSNYRTGLQEECILANQFGLIEDERGGD